MEFEEKDEKKQSNPHIDLILDSISEVKCVSWCPVSNKCCNFWILENETHLFCFQYYQGLDS